MVIYLKNYKGEFIIVNIIKKLIKRLLFLLSKSDKFQHLLERIVGFCQYLMGIGSGSFAERSGEIVLAEKLNSLYKKSGHTLCVFDVGAKKGQFLEMIIDYFKKKSISYSVHAFEPSIYTYNILYQNFKNANGITFNPNYALDLVQFE